MHNQISEIDRRFEKGMENVLSSPETSFELGKEICKIAKEIKHENSLAKGYLLQGYSGFFLGLHGRSFEFTHIALPIFIKCKDKKNQAAAYNTLGFIYNYFEDHENRLKFNLKSLEIRKEIEDHDGFIRSLNNTGDSLLSLNKHSEALSYFEQCLALTNPENKRMLCVVHSNIADTYFRMFHHKKSHEHLEISNHHAKEINSIELIGGNTLIKAKILNKTSQYREAIDEINRFIKEESTKELSDVTNLYLELAISYEGIEEYQKALSTTKQHHKLKDEELKQKQQKDLKSLKFRKQITQLEGKAKTLESLVEIRTNELKTALESEKIISYFSRELNDTTTINEALWSITKNIISTLNLDDCVIYMIDFERNVLVQEAAFGPKNIDYHDILSPMEIPLGRGIVGHVALHGMPEMIQDTQKDSRYIVDDQMRQSELAVPIYYNKKVIGVIDSEHSTANYFNDRHLYIFNMISSLLESHFSRLKEQDIKENLQKEIIKINSNLEQQIEDKSKENTELNHKILEQDKKVLVGEIAAFIAHEMNTPLAAIKAGGESILFLFNKIFQAQVATPLQQEDLNFILPRIATKGSSIVPKNRGELDKAREKIQAKITKLDLKFGSKIIGIMAKMSIQKEKDLLDLVQTSNPILTLSILYDINAIYGFNRSLIEMSKNTNTSIANLKSLVLNEENKVKKRVMLSSTFYGLEQHVRLHHPNVLVNLKILDDVEVLAYDFQTIQLWSNLIHLILVTSEFKKPPTIRFNSFQNSDKTVIRIQCKTSKINTPIYDDSILSYRFIDDYGHSIKLKLNIIQNIIDDHNAQITCSAKNQEITLDISFTESY